MSERASPQKGSLSPEDQAYQAWMIDRGILGAPAAPVAGAFIFDSKESATILILSIVDGSPSEEMTVMLRRLAGAVGEPTSLFVQSSATSISVRGLQLLHPNINLIVTLGTEAEDLVNRAGILGERSAVRLVAGPAPGQLLNDPDSKRSFWELLKVELNHFP